MPVLSAAQTIPPATQAASLSVRVTLSAAQAIPALSQAASLATPPIRTLSAAQVLPAFGQVARLVRSRFQGPATPRPERAPAKPRP